MMMDRIDSSYLQNLVGKKVRLYKGGPESRTGTLLDVKSDYLTLFTEKDGVVYYDLKHIKSVSKHSKEDETYPGSLPVSADENDYYVSANNFYELLANLTDCGVQIDRGGPESEKGNLLDVKSDYLVLETKDGVIYYKLHHIKSISETKDGPGMRKEKLDYVVPFAEKEQHQYRIEARDFEELLQALKHRWIKINRGGPESIEGLLVDSNKDYLVLVIDDEVNHIPTFHIRNITVVVKRKKDKDQDENDKDKKDGDKEDQSGKDHDKGRGEDDPDDDDIEFEDAIDDDNDDEDWVIQANYDDGDSFRESMNSPSSPWLSKKIH